MTFPHFFTMTSKNTPHSPDIQPVENLSSKRLLIQDFHIAPIPHRAVMTPHAAIQPPLKFNLITKAIKLARPLSPGSTAGAQTQSEAPLWSPALCVLSTAAKTPTRECVHVCTVERDAGLARAVKSILKLGRFYQSDRSSCSSHVVLFYRMRF